MQASIDAGEVSVDTLDADQQAKLASRVAVEAELAALAL